MDETTLGIIGSLAAIGLLVAAAAFMDHRVRTRGGLFEGRLSLAGRLMALLTGLGLIAITFVLSNNGFGVRISFAAAGLMCLGYAIGLEGAAEMLDWLGTLYAGALRLSQADVERVVMRDYPAGQYREVMALLDRCQGDDPFRVRLAALRLAGGDIARLPGLIDEAGRDAQKIIALAEAPALARLGAAASEAEARQASAEDRREYRRWLRKR